MWRSIRVIRNLYERFQNALGKMYGLWIHCVIITDPLVGMLKFCQAPLVLSSNFTFSSTARMSYRHVYLTGSETQNSLSMCSGSKPYSLLLPAYFPYWHWHLLDWETLKTSPFMSLRLFPLSPTYWHLTDTVLTYHLVHFQWPPKETLHKLSHIVSIPSCQGKLFKLVVWNTFAPVSVWINLPSFKTF